MVEIAAQRQADRARDSDTGLHRIEESTATIEAGMRNPWVYIVFLISLILIPFTGGLSFGGSIVCLLMMTKNGKAIGQAIQPTTADIAAPGPGCVRIVGATLALVLLLVTVVLFLFLAYANVEVRR
jgi:hypothetical protein